MKIYSTAIIITFFASIASLLGFSPMANKKSSLSDKLFPPNLGDTPCDLKAYHLGSNTPFPALKPALKLFWESSFAPKCEQKALSPLVEWYMSYRKALVPNELLQPFACGLKDYHLGENAPFPALKPAFKLFWESSFAPICEEQTTFNILVRVAVQEMNATFWAELSAALAEIKPTLQHVYQHAIKLSAEIRSALQRGYQHAIKLLAEIKPALQCGYQRAIKLSAETKPALQRGYQRTIKLSASFQEALKAYSHEINWPGSELSELWLTFLKVFLGPFCMGILYEEYKKNCCKRQRGSGGRRDQRDQPGGRWDQPMDQPIITATMILHAANVLCIDPDQASDFTLVKRTYRQLARKHHPDKGGDAASFRQIQEAYELLQQYSELSQ